MDRPSHAVARELREVQGLGDHTLTGERCVAVQHHRHHGVTVFAVALLCSGLSSSTVGVMAGQVIIEGFLDIKFPIFLRRFITVVPALVIIATGLDPLKILVLSQVVLSFALPFALIPLLLLTSRTSVMQSFASARRTRIAGWVTVTVIIALNAILLGQLAFGL